MFDDMTCVGKEVLALFDNLTGHLSASRVANKAISIVKCIRFCMRDTFSLLAEKTLVIRLKVALLFISWTILVHK